MIKDYLIKANKCIVTREKKGNTISQQPKPGHYNEFVVKMHEEKAPIKVYPNFSKALREQHQIDTYDWDVVSIIDTTKNEIVFQKDIQEYYSFPLENEPSTTQI